MKFIIPCRIQDDRGLDIAALLNGVLSNAPGIITSISNAAKGGVSGRLLDKTPDWIVSQVIISRTYLSVRKFELLEICIAYFAI